MTERLSISEPLFSQDELSEMPTRSTIVLEEVRVVEEHVFDESNGTYVDIYIDLRHEYFKARSVYEQ